MKLLSISECQHMLYIEFSQFEPDFVSNFFLKSFKLDDLEWRKVEQSLGVNKLPTSFTKLIEEYDFGNFSIMNIQFGIESTGSLNWLIELNNPSLFGFESFINELRKNSLILIARGDPFAILLDTTTGYISAISSNESIKTRHLVAKSFEHFIQGMCTAFMSMRRDSTPDFRALARQEFGPDAYYFWHQITL